MHYNDMIMFFTSLLFMCVDGSLYQGYTIFIQVANFTPRLRNLSVCYGKFLT